MKKVSSIFTKPFISYNNNEYSKYILESKFKMSLTSVILYFYLILSAIEFFIIYVTMFFNQLPFLIFGSICVCLSPLGIQKIFDYIITNEIQQFDLDCTFILRELLVITKSTNSESQAYFLLATNTNQIIKNFGKNAFIERNIFSYSSIDAIIAQLDKFEKSKMTKYLQTVFRNWFINEINILSYSDNYQKIIHAQLDEDFHQLENNTTIINALIGLFPIFTIFLIFIGLRNIHPLLEVVLIVFIGLLLLIWILDPLRINPIREFFGSYENIENSIGLNLLQDFYSLLIINQNFTKSLQQLAIKNHIYKLEKNTEKIINLNFTDFSNINSDLIDLITIQKGSKLAGLFKLLFELQKIDFNSVLIQLPEFIANYSSIEQYYRKKISLIKVEKKKSKLILWLNSFTLGVLSIILPYLLYINSFNFSIVQNINFNSFLRPKIELLTSIEFLFFLFILYLIYYTSYNLVSKMTLIRNITVNTFLFIIGFGFCLLLLRPTIILI